MHWNMKLAVWTPFNECLFLAELLHIYGKYTSNIYSTPFAHAYDKVFRQMNANAKCPFWLSDIVNHGHNHSNVVLYSFRREWMVRLVKSVSRLQVVLCLSI